jgi:hypothetical protein
MPCVDCPTTPNRIRSGSVEARRAATSPSPPRMLSEARGWFPLSLDESSFGRNRSRSKTFRDCQPFSRKDMPRFVYSRDRWLTLYNKSLQPTDLPVTTFAYAKDAPAISAAEFKR